MKKQYYIQIFFSLLFSMFTICASQHLSAEIAKIMPNEIAAITTIQGNLDKNQYAQAFNNIEILKNLTTVRIQAFEDSFQSIIQPQNVNRGLQLSKSHYFDAIRSLRTQVEKWINTYESKHYIISKNFFNAFAQNVNNPNFSWENFKAQFKQGTPMGENIMIYVNVLEPLHHLRSLLRTVELDFAVAHLRNYYYLDSSGSSH